MALQGATSFDIVIADKCASFDQATASLPECPVTKVAPQMPAVVLCSWTDWDTKVRRSQACGQGTHPPVCIRHGGASSTQPHATAFKNLSTSG